MNRLVLPALLMSAAFAVACGDDAALGQQPKDGKIKLLDGGFVAPPTPDAGLDAGADGGADAGLAAYDGGPPEVGVRCGDALDACGVGSPCCATVTSFDPPATTASCAATPAPDAGPSMCGPFDFAFGCDDTPTDCDAAGGEVCCFHFLYDQQALTLELDTQCKEAGSCFAGGDGMVCTSDADCGLTGVCCGLDVGIALPIDMGLCLTSCDGSVPLE